MYILVASDNQEFATRVRQVLIRCGLFAADAPNLAANSGPQLVPLELAAERASRFVPALVVIVVQPDRERALAALRDVQTCGPNLHSPGWSGRRPQIHSRVPS